jgi:hypothetical protein
MDMVSSPAESCRDRFKSLTNSKCVAGIEIDFAGMSPEELQLTRSVADEVGLEISVTLVMATFTRQLVVSRIQLTVAASSHPGQNISDLALPA